MPTLVGSTLDKYEILEEVGHGGMAVVYRAQDRVLKREVAVKVLHAHLANKEESRLRLEREAIAVAKLRHDNILEIFDYSGASAHESYIVTEFIHGPTLKTWIDEGFPTRPAIAALIVYHLCCALDHAHHTGIIHRDIKPENVMVRSTDGCLKLMDFGIAQILDNQKLTLTGQLIGSPAYMAPELIGGRPLDARTDLFAVGILLYQLSTQRLPFDGRNPHEVLNRIADGIYSPPSSFDPRIDPDLEAIIERALAVDPQDRYQDAGSFAGELEEYLRELGLDPATTDLSRYFLAPQRFVEELDEAVVEVLLARAEEAERRGDRARAFQLLARVLEFQPDHASARTLLQRLRVRAARVRRASVAAASIGLVAIAAGATLWWNKEQPLTQTEAHAMAAPRVQAETPAASAEELPLATESPATEPQSLGTAGSTGASAESEPLPEPELAAAKQQSAATRGRVLRDRRLARADAGNEMTRCRVMLTDIAPSTATNFALKIGSRSFPITQLPMTVEFPGSEAKLVLAHEVFKARKTLTREACAAGEVKVPVMVGPAEIEFSNAPPNLTVYCTRGCAAKDLGRNRMSLSPIPMPPGETAVTVEMTLSSAGYQKKTITKRLAPGLNKLPADLELNPM